jgi:hypothetical protein
MAGASRFARRGAAGCHVVRLWIGETEVYVLGVIRGARDRTALWHEDARDGPADS